MAHHRQELRLAQQQTLYLSLSMRQSIQALELPIEELNEWLERESPSDRPLSAETAYRPSLFQTLMAEARLELEPHELETAEWIIGNLDERGFYPLEVTEEQLSVLQKIQQLGPPGIAARNLRECLLLQLKKYPFAYRLVRDHLDDLLHNRLKKILQKMGCSLRQLKEVVKRQILRVNFSPALRFSEERVPLLIPDLTIDKEGDAWIISVNEPGFRELDRGLLEALERRKRTLKKIARALIDKMPDFFEGNVSFPSPLTMKEIAEELDMHESTIARAVSGKSIQCEQGVIPLRSFFTASVQTASGETISNCQVKQLLGRLIAQENKEAPFSDEALSSKIRSQGYPCARRTVSKYRKELKILSASQRKKH